jgi:hypothetical protein
MRKVLSVFIAVCLVLSMCTGIFASVPTARAATLSIGDSYGGGKVAYILQSGDPGYSSTATKGLIAATADQSTGIIWAVAAYQSTAVTGTETTLGSGSANTDKIIAQNGAGITYAAGLCDAYTNTETGTGVYSDWYLPSLDELNKLYLSKAVLTGFSEDYYWSSSESGNDSAWSQNFSGGSYGIGKNAVVHVRAVRSFTVSSDATLKASSTVKGRTVTSLGTPHATLGSQTAGAVTITLTQAADTSNAGSFITLFDKTNAGATVKVVKYATGVDPTSTFATDTAYANQAITTADFFIVKVTAADTSTVLYYKVVVTVTLGIGDNYQGGKVAYIYSVDGQVHGLIAATADQHVYNSGVDPEFWWALPAHQGTSVPGATGTAIGTGLANTNAIVAQNGPGSTYAAGLARAYDGGGYTDWYLPSQDELNQLYVNRVAIGGGFGGLGYWSSSEYSASEAWYQSFGTGAQNPGIKSQYTYTVRPVRTFPSSDASIEAGTLGGVALTSLPREGTDNIGSSAYIGVTVAAGSRALEFTKGNANSVIKYVLLQDVTYANPQPANDAAYTGTYTPGGTTITITSSSDRIWLLVIAEDGTKRYYWIMVTVASSDATITGGALEGVALVGTSWAGGASTALSTELTATVFGGATNDILGLTKGNTSSVVTYVAMSTGTPANDAAYAYTYGSGTTIDTTSNTIIWLLVTAQDGTTKLYYKITTTAASSNATITSTTYTVSGVVGGAGTITNVPFGTAKATFLAALVKGQADQTWASTAIANPVVSTNTLVVTAQDGTTVVTYAVTVTANTGTVTIAAGAGGSVLPTSVSQTYGATGAAIAATPNNGYHFVGWSATSNPTYVSIADGSAASTTFTTTSLMPDGGTATITATFAVNTYTVTVTSGPNGTVTPGTGTVDYHTTQAYAVKPNSGYLIDTLMVDGVAVREAASRLGFTLTLTDVTAPHTIAATFRAIPDVLSPTITIPDFSLLPGVTGWSGGTVLSFTVGSSPFLLQFTLEDNSGSVKWTIKVNGVIIIDPAGTGLITYPIPLSEGRNDVEVIATDAAGNSTSRRLVIYLDSTGPMLTIEPALPASVTTPRLTIAGSVADAVSGLKWVRINGMVVIPFLDGSFREMFTLAKGANAIVIEAEDKVGHKTTTTHTVTYATAIQPLPAATVITLTIGSMDMEVNGLTRKLDAAPFIKDGRTLLPIRALVESLGGTVRWNASTKTATVSLGGRIIGLTIGSKTALLNGKRITLDVAPVIVSGRTFLPLRAVAQNLGLDLAWEPVSQTISLTYWP